MTPDSDSSVNHTSHPPRIHRRRAPYAAIGVSLAVMFCCIALIGWTYSRPQHTPGPDVVGPSYSSAPGFRDAEQSSSPSSDMGRTLSPSVESSSPAPAPGPNFYGASRAGFPSVGLTCNGSDHAVLVMETTGSYVVICKSRFDTYEYRGKARRNSAITLAAIKVGDSYLVRNGGVQYLVDPDEGLKISGTVNTSEPAVNVWQDN